MARFVSQNLGFNSGVAQLLVVNAPSGPVTMNADFDGQPLCEMTINSVSG